MALLRHRARNPGAPLLVEDEGRAVGSVHLPRILHEALRRSPLVILEATVDERIANTHAEYVHQALAEYRRIHGENAGFDHWAAYLADSLQRIRKRLGAARYQHLSKQLEEALALHRAQGDTSGHEAWIRGLLVDYYDPMYDYQIRGSAARIVFRGNADAVTGYLDQRLSEG